MRWDALETSFNRAFFLSFSRRKFFIVFPVLVLCGILIVFCRGLAFEASRWMAMSLIFLPIFLSSGILLALGIILIRIYAKEVKQIKIELKEILKTSWELIISTSYLSVPSILLYLFLWMILGIFVLLKEIPYFGNFVGVILSFAPFLIILTSILLVIFNLGLLFFASSAIAEKSEKTTRMAKDLCRNFMKNIFSNLIFFFVALFPIFFVVGTLVLSAWLTGVSYLVAEKSLSVALEWFFIMIPFCALLTPAVIFFFNFAQESYLLLQEEKKESLEK